MQIDLQQQLIRDLITESNEALDQFEGEILSIERGESNGETLHTMFRVIHSLKGTSGCLGLSRIESLAHAGENLLSLMREGKTGASPQATATLLRCSDALRAMLASLGPDGRESDSDHSVLVADLRALAEATSNPLEAKAPEQTGPGSSGLFFEDSEEMPVPAPEPVRKEAITVVPAPAAMPTPAPAPTPHAATETAIRVDIAQLDSLMDLVGELVLARNQIVQFAGRLQEPALLQSTQRLNMITTKLQENVMKTRMQPIGNVWSKFPRIVRDISQDLGKRVQLVMEGAQTELDRTIIEAIKDPLMHLVRNAVDHGIETPERRMEVGKPGEGTLRMRAFHESGQVNIEIRDDGAGIYRDRILERAVAKGLLHPDQTARMTDREVFGMIFAPGFSTAEKVTNISGRGVGMDVVKKNVEKIGGSVDIQSDPGHSTTIRIKIPLTLAIIPALIIRCGASRYAIPQASLTELVRVEAENVSRAIESIEGAPVYRLRGNLLPLLYLREHLKLPAKPSGEAVFLLVLQAEGRQFGLVVDSIHDTEEIVVKPLGKELKGLSVYAGATIMGDGRVALILDILGVARRAKLLEEVTRRAAERNAETHAGGGTKNTQSLLLFSLSGGQRAAMPLSRVARLEEFEASQIESAGDQEVVQYRGEIMQLLRVARLLGRAETPSEDGSIRVVVHNRNGRSVGLVVEEILDTLDEEVKLRKSSARPGLLGSSVIQKKVTDFIDTDALLEAAGLDLSETEEARS